MPELTRTCQCLNLGPDTRCTALMTQEDLLCDNCRRNPDVPHGCLALGPSQMAGAGTAGGSSPHVRVDFPEGFFGSFSFLPRGS